MNEVENLLRKAWKEAQAQGFDLSFASFYTQQRIGFSPYLAKIDIEGPLKTNGVGND